MKQISQLESKKTVCCNNETAILNASTLSIQKGFFFYSLEFYRPHSNVIELIFIAPTIVTSLPQPIRDYKCARNTGKGCWARVCIPTASMINTLSKEKMDKKKRSEREAFLS